MVRRLVGVLCLFIFCGGCLAQLGQLTSHGGVSFPGHAFLRSLRVNLWSRTGDGYVNNGGGSLVSGATESRKTLALSAPFHQGSVEVCSRRDERGRRFVQQVVFDRDQSLRSMCLGVQLQASSLGGVEYLLLPSMERRRFPRTQEKMTLARFNGTGIAISLGGGRYLAIQGECSEPRVSVQDSRCFGSDMFEVRFPLGANYPLQGVRYESAVSFREVDGAGLERLCAALCPPAIDIDKHLLFMPDRSGICALNDGSKVLVSLQIGVHGTGWSYLGQDIIQATSRVNGSGRRFQGGMPIPNTKDGVLLIEEELQPRDQFQEAAMDYVFTLKQPQRMNGYQLSFLSGLEYYAGATVRLDTLTGPTELVIGKTLGESIVFSGKVRGYSVSSPVSRHNFSVRFKEPVHLLLQDNRGWGGNTFEFRVCVYRSETGLVIPAGEKRVSFTLRGGDAEHGMRVVTDGTLHHSRTDTRSWFPYVLGWDRPCPVDLSYLNAKPAGASGFIGVRGDRFVTLGNGSEIRFWGTCFSAGANFPTHAQAEKIAKRLSSYGINMVRTHHADASWAENCLFPKTSDTTRVFDRENLDRFDYLIYCLKREGIYIYLDQLVNRRFRKGDGVDNVDQLPVAGKPYSYFDPRLIELQKEYSKGLWTHVNPYTKLAYKDEPAIALMEFANENDLFSQQVTLEPYRTRFEVLYRDWASKQGIVLPTGKIDFCQKTDAMVAFFIHIHDRYHEEMESYLRDLGVKVPMTGSNWSRGPQLLLSLEKLDFTDSHSYWNHPRKGGTFDTASMLRSQRVIMDTLGAQRLRGKPFFVSEWDAPWPYEYRAELPGWMAAVASFQGWNGLTVYTYRHSSVPVDYIQGSFETFADPARFGLFPAAALLYRRGDVAPGRTLRRVTFDRGQSATTKAQMHHALKEMHGLSCLNRFALEFDGTGAGVLPSVHAGIVSEDRTISEGGEIRRDLQAGLVQISSPRSQLLSAFFEPGKTYGEGGLRVRVPRKRFGTVAVTSLTDSPIVSSPRTLVTVVGRAENTGFTYSLLRNRRTTTGHGPVLCEDVSPFVDLRHDRREAKVYAVDAHGGRMCELPSSWHEGRLSFQCVEKTIYYLIE